MADALLAVSQPDPNDAARASAYAPAEAPPLTVTNPVAPPDEHMGVRPLWTRIFEAVSIASFGAIWVTLAHQVATVAAADQLSWMWWVAIPMAYVATDFASGMFHWFCDSFFERDTPVIGKLLIEPFREHHRDPTGMTRHGFLELHGNNCFGAASLLGIFLAIGVPAASPWGMFAYMFLVAFGVGVVLTNQCHKWAHDREHAAGWVKVLMSTGLILSTRHHDSHHSGDHTSGYCITTGWMNRLLDPIRFFPSAERVIRRLSPFCRKTPSWVAQAHLLPPGSVKTDASAAL